VTGRLATGGSRSVSATSFAFEQRLRDLRAPGILDADEKDVRFAYDSLAWTYCSSPMMPIREQTG
jgi:hypothetical protein